MILSTIGITFILFIFFRLGKKVDSFIFFWLFLLGMTILAIGLFIPSDYNEWELTEKSELCPISSSDSSDVYIFISSDNVYMYKCSTDSEIGNNNPDFDMVKANSKKVEIVEDETCTTPVLKEYSRSSKATIWTFGIFIKDEKYVFYVPKGTTFFI